MAGVFALLRKDMDELVGNIQGQTTDTRLPQKNQQETVQKQSQRSFAPDIRLIKSRAARTVIIAAVSIWAWVFTAQPAAVFLGFALALFDLLVGVNSMPQGVLAVKSLFKHKEDLRIPEWVEKSETYWWMRKEFQERLRLASAGVALPGSPTTRARRSINLLLAVAPGMILGAGVAAIYVNPFLIFLAIAPVVIIIAPLVTLKFKKVERGDIEEELPFFLILAEMFSLVERPLIQAFEALARLDLLLKMRREAEIVRRDVNAFGYTPEQAIDNLAKNHPNAEFRQILRGYLSSVKLGQSASSYLQNKAETYLARLESRYERFKENAGTAGEVMLIALMVVPITGSMLGSQGGLSSYVMAGSIPLIGVAVFFMLDKAQVKGPPIRFRPQLLPVVAAVVVVVITISFTRDLNTIIFASAAAFAIPHGIVVRRKIKHEDTLVFELAEFLRVVAEGMKTGLDVLSALRYTEAERFKALKPHIKHMQYELARGGTLEDTRANVHFHMRFTIFIVGELASSGAASFAMLDRLAEYQGKVREDTLKAKKAVMMYSMLVVSTPLFIVFSTHALQSMATMTQAQTSSTSQVFPAMQLLQGLAGTHEVSQLTLLLTTLCAGALGGKIANQTLRDTLPLSLACILALISPTLISVIWPLPS
jgi:Flp pilus assembly protein TadB